MENAAKLFTLPLSWKINSKSISNNTILQLTKKTKWIAFSDVPSEITGNNFIKNIADQKSNILIRGCSDEISLSLKEQKFERIKTGKEAVLNFDENHFEKKSLKELIRRGHKHGRTIELEYSEKNAARLIDFKKQTVHSEKPQLKYLFHDQFTCDMRLFVLENKSKEILAAVLVSVNSMDKFHTELLLRRKRAPVGVMEAIIYDVFQLLMKSSKKQLSLGEVPFSSANKETGESYKAKSIKRIGKFLRFAYNYEGLFNFKNKFNPDWQNVYLCVKPKLSIWHLIILANRTNLIKLIFSKIFQRKN
ncbi:MAG: DUF2156 domain-containing protein [Melioribacteraceae bacterium]|nr:DUF2156 domain-containing protein [Melioribacteraceae bacterium]MCF8355951.1 DUF2156 domain-containing protein [Melioribacteraceae bacterium]MCF8395804.1 DUF2156 domain-containing protein [Melioribacteraceae bacterium]MCF8420796.1 DUF2156 domain-containing protein [Melioribacteraceae bacterium]